MRLLGYVRVSTADQGDSGLGLDAQKAQIKVYCVQQGYDLAGIVEEVESSGKKRPVLDSALDDVERGLHDGLIVAKLDRMCRSVVEANEIASRLTRHDRTLIALDLGMDTSTATGRAFLNLVATFAQWERDVISERTRAALAAKAARGEKLGMERTISPEARSRAQQLRRHGCSYRQIIEQLTEEGHKTPGGGPWRISTIQRLLKQRPDDQPRRTPARA